MQKGRRFAIADIHACLLTFRHLVEEVLSLDRSDHLYLLGDYVDRGPDSRGVMDYIMNLTKSGYQVHALRGNHEDDLLRYTRDEARFLMWHLRKGKYTDIVDQEERMLDKYLNFLKSLPYFLELDDYYLVHGGFDFKLPDPFEVNRSMLWIRYFDPPAEKVKGKQVLRGHDPTPREVIEEQVAQKHTVITLDNGLTYRGKHPYYDTSTMGCLVAFNMDSRELHWQKNLDQS